VGENRLLLLVLLVVVVKLGLEALAEVGVHLAKVGHATLLKGRALESLFPDSLVWVIKYIAIVLFCIPG
jgi:hypothetical protein